MRTGLLSIGMFSRASNVSVKQLRAYHEMGLLIPAAVDPGTGYRHYAVEQLTDAVVIVRLRALDLPLQQVREVLTARDPDRTRAVLEVHRATMQERLVQTEQIVAELQSGLAPATHTPVHVRLQKATTTLTIGGAITMDEVGSWLGHAFGALVAAGESCGAIPIGPGTATYQPEIVDDGPQPVTAHLPIAEPPPLLPTEARVGGVTVGALAAAECAVLVHAGSYASIGRTYQSLGAWVASHADHAVLPIREHYLVGPESGADATAYRTEICWPIVPGSGPPEPRHTQEEP